MRHGPGPSPAKSNVERFLAAMQTPQRVRWKILTGIAHAMDMVEMGMVKASEVARREKRVATLKRLDCPKVIMEHEERMLREELDGTSAIGKLFVRVIKSRVRTT